MFVSKGGDMHWVASPEPRGRAKKSQGRLAMAQNNHRAIVRQRNAGFLIDVEYFSRKNWISRKSAACTTPSPEPASGGPSSRHAVQ